MSDDTSNTEILIAIKSLEQRYEAFENEIRSALAQQRDLMQIEISRLAEEQKENRNSIARFAADQKMTREDMARRGEEGRHIKPIPPETEPRERGFSSPPWERKPARPRLS